MGTFDLENPQPLPGDALRDEAANLLSVRYGRPTREKRVYGKKADLYFTKSEFGKITHIFLEAKDFARTLSRNEVRSIWKDYEGIVDKRRPASLLIVTRRGLSPDAQAYVNDEISDLRHQTIWELENESLGLTEYIRSLTELFGEDGLDTYYVESSGNHIKYDEEHERAVDPERLPLFEVVQEWINNQSDRPIAVLGGYGAGKTSLAKRVVASQAADALANPLARRPVLIKLGDLARYSSLEGLLGGMFTHDFPVDGFNVRRFLDLNAKGRLLIVLDGFDEMKHAMSWADFRNQISDLNRLSGDLAKVILFGRPSAFTTEDEHLHVLRGLKRYSDGFRRLPEWPEFVEFELSEFTKEERSAFIGGYLSYLAEKGPYAHIGNGSWIRGRVQQVNQLADADEDLFGKPVHSKILVNMASDPNVDLTRLSGGINRRSLYQVFFQSLIERESEKDARRPIPEQSRFKFLQEVAFWLWTEKGGATSFSAADVSDRLLDDLSPGDSADLDSQKREYLTGSFLEKKSGDIYYFGHRSFAEFLVAERMVSRPPSGFEHSIFSMLVRDGVKTFLGEVADKNAFADWAKSLDGAQGEICIEYLQFLGQALGGRDNLRAQISADSPLRVILQIFQPDMSLFGRVEESTLAAMRTEDDRTFFLLLSLLLYWLPSVANSGSKFLEGLAAAILDRLFQRVNVDENARNGSVEHDHQHLLRLAKSVTPRLVEGVSEKELMFDGQALSRERSTAFRQYGTDIVFQPPTKIRSIPDLAQISWLKVLQLMGTESRKKARTYFQMNRDLSNIFARKVQPKRKWKPSKS